MSEGSAPAAEPSLAAGEGAVVADAGAAPVQEASAPEVAVQAVEPSVADATVEAAAEAAAEAEPAKEGDQPADAEAADAAAEGAEGADVQLQEPAKPEPVKYEPFKLPEGMLADDAQLSAFGNIMGKYGMSQDAAQEVMDFGGNVLKQAAEKMRQDQVDAFAETRRNWVKDFEKSAGNRRNTVLADAKHGLSLAFPNEKDRAELHQVLAFTGAGDHPLVIRAFAALGKRLREGTAPGPSLPADPRQNLSPADRRYGRNN